MPEAVCTNVGGVEMLEPTSKSLFDDLIFLFYWQDQLVNYSCYIKYSKCESIKRRK